MGILYGWTKEYLFEHMSFGQIVMYLNEGMRFKYPKPQKENSGSLIGASAEEIRQARDRLHAQYGNIGAN